MVIEPATPADFPILEAMLLEAFYWDPQAARPTLAAARANPAFRGLLAGWGRAGDVALVARQAGAALGAAWFRLWTAAEHSYGFLDEDTPELGLAVIASARGQGIGRALLRQLCAQAAEAGYPALSLSVDPANTAAHRLYEAAGFRPAGPDAKGGTSLTLRRALGGVSSAP
jgi:ribosomal protein S18 acetylase RimI-like enzyme